MSRHFLKPGWSHFKITSKIFVFLSKKKKNLPFQGALYHSALGELESWQASGSVPRWCVYDSWLYRLLGEGLHVVTLVPGVLMLFLSFFAFLHCWLNAFAEMLRFGDRMFYKVLNALYSIYTACVCTHVRAHTEV